ncbi:hypothetical protein [Microbacterium stercoris]|uniref:Lipoprotein n=1 Tax=Microbacterium stercoris TaxID=2820289 RepID=A0A939QL37_9MICO|nr:hypothetical protein [Microbacterium stercoris]MBO3664175.1 hypothetical protein [Microbacterium stercoris]
MRSTRALRLSVAALTAAFLVPSLAACAAVGDALQREATHEFASRDELAHEWSREAPWVPADAETIRIRESLGGEPASLALVSASDLDPETCADVERRSAPTLAVEKTPDVYKIDRVFVCGKWAVVPTEDGWYGWTPVHPDERAASPTR